MTKPVADLLNPKRKGRFRRLRRQSLAAVKKGAPLQGTVLPTQRIAGSTRDHTLEPLRTRGGLTKAQLERHQWVSNDGRIIPVTQMRDAHLMNTLDMLTRRRREKHQQAVDLQSKSHEGSLNAAKASARAAQWMLILEAEMLRRHPDYLSASKVKPTGLELYALPDFYTGGVLAPAQA